MNEKVENQSRKNTETEGTFIDTDRGIKILLILLFLLLWFVAVICIIGSIKTHFIKKNGDMYTINAEYARSYVDEKFRIRDIYKTEENDAEIQYIMVFADSESAGPVFGENTVFTVYKYKSDTLCYVGEKRIRYDFLSDDMFLLLTEGRRTNSEI